MGRVVNKSIWDVKVHPDIDPIPYEKNIRGRVEVICGSSCLTEPAAAFLGLANGRLTSSFVPFFV